MHGAAREKKWGDPPPAHGSCSGASLGVFLFLRVSLLLSLLIYFSGASLVVTASAFNPAPPSLCETINSIPCPIFE